MLRILTRIVGGLLWAVIAGYAVYHTGDKLSRYENPLNIAGYVFITLYILQTLHFAVCLRHDRPDALNNLIYPYALVVTTAIISFSWLELRAAPPYFSQYRLAIAEIAGLSVFLLLLFSYLYNKLYLPYIGQSLVALALFAWDLHFATWLWLSLSIFYSYGYEYARYLDWRNLARENPDLPRGLLHLTAYPEVFSFLTFFTFTGLTLTWLQTTNLPFPTWAYWVVLTLLMITLSVSWLRMHRHKPIPARCFTLARFLKRCTPVSWRP